jgi:myo-inositol-1(or 4)-monophosphatase
LDPTVEPWRREARVAGWLARWAASRMRSDAAARRDGGAVRIGDRTKDNPADLVTPTDRAIELQVRRTLGRHFPRHAIEGEEFGRRPGDPDAPFWLVDPVDGTSNFAHDVGWSSFSLGLLDADGPALAVVADPWRGELFGAVRGRGARLDEQRTLEVASVDRLEGQLVLTEWAGHRPWPGMSGVLSGLADRYCTTRIMGSTALSIVQVAAGRAAATLIGSCHRVDALPAVLIALEAGAVAVGLDGAPLFPAAARAVDPLAPMLVATPGVAAEVLELWRSALAGVAQDDVRDTVDSAAES